MFYNFCYELSTKPLLFTISRGATESPKPLETCHRLRRFLKTTMRMIVLEFGQAQVGYIRFSKVKLDFGYIFIVESCFF